MLIAVASKSGKEVDTHFGHAERFLIYDCAGGAPKLVEEKLVEKYCSFDPDHPFRHSQFNSIAEALKGCKAVVTAMIGELPKQELEKLGIASVVLEGPIDQALIAAHGQFCGCGFSCGGGKRC